MSIIITILIGYLIMAGINISLVMGVIHASEERAKREGYTVDKTKESIDLDEKSNLEKIMYYILGLIVILSPIFQAKILLSFLKEGPNIIDVIYRIDMRNGKFVKSKENASVNDDDYSRVIVNASDYDKEERDKIFSLDFDNLSKEEQDLLLSKTKKAKNSEVNDVVEDNKETYSSKSEETIFLQNFYDLSNEEKKQRLKAYQDYLNNCGTVEDEINDSKKYRR